MSGCRFIHAADLHLDSPFKGRLELPERLLQHMRESTFRALARIVALAIHEQVDFVLFSGDIYDASDRSLRAQFRFKEALEELGSHGIRSFVIHGNHDPLAGYRAALDWPDTVHVFSAERVESVTLRRAGGEAYATVYGISYRQAAEPDNLALRYEVNRDVLGGVHIAMLHANVDGHAGHDNYAPCRLQELKGSGFDYWALGHIHTRAVLHERPWVVYPGNPQGRHMKETGPRGVMLVEVEGGGKLDLRFCRTDAIEWQVARVDITGLETEQDLVEALLEALDSADPVELAEEALGRRSMESRSRLVRLELTGRGPLHRSVLSHSERTADLLAELREHRYRKWEHEAVGFVWPESLQVRTGEAWSREELLEGEGFISELLLLADKLKTGSVEERSSFVREALGELYGGYRLGQLVEAPTEDELAQWLDWAEERVLELLLEGGSRG